MEKEQLQELGLTEHEATVYVALLQTGPTTTGPIIKRTGLYRVLVYDVLEKLLKRGLVTYSLQKNRKRFEAENPQQLLEIVKNKEIIARQVVKELEKIHTKNSVEEGAFIYEGWKGIRAAQEKYFEELKKGAEGEYLMVGASRALHKKLDGFFNYFHQRRSELSVPAKLIFNENNKSFGKVKMKYSPVEVRFMPKNVITPSWISTYKDMVLIGVAEETPMAFFIKNKAVAESYQQYFYFMWEQSKPA